MQRLELRADFTLGAGSDGIDPLTEDVRISLRKAAVGIHEPDWFIVFSPGALAGGDIGQSGGISVQKGIPDGQGGYIMTQDEAPNLQVLEASLRPKDASGLRWRLKLEADRRSPVGIRDPDWFIPAACSSGASLAIGNDEGTALPAKAEAKFSMAP